MMKHLWKRWISKGLLLTTLVTQSSLLAALTAPAAALAASGTPVVINEVSPAGDWIELFATSDVQFNDADGWTLVTTNGTSVRLAGTMTPGQFQTFTFATAPLGLDNGSVKLTHGNLDVDVIRWGNERGTDVPGVTGNSTIARTDNGSGRWVSNVTATFNSSNNTVMTDLPPVVTVVKLPATGSSPVNAINNSSQTNVTVQAGYSGTATVAASLLDNKNGTTAVSVAGSATMDGGAVTGLDASSLSDGTAYARAYLVSGSSKRSAWTTQTIVKDTIAPATPAPYVIARAKNGQNVINANNASDVRIGFGTPGSDAASLTATLTDSAATSVSGSLPLDASRGLDAHGLLDGQLTLSVTITDTAGNVSAPGTASPGKDTVAPAPASDLRGRAASGYVTLDWDASSSADIGSYRIYSNGGTGTIDPNSPLGETKADSRSFTTGLQPSGQTIYQVRAVDRFGNEETTGVNVTITVTGPLVEQALGGNNRILNLIDPLRLWLRIADSTSGSAELTVLNNSTTNPTSVSVPGGHVAVGKYFDLGTSNQTIFPMEVKLYYTLLDLKAAGVSDERMLEGIRFYDGASKSWKLYGQTGVSTKDVTIDSLDFAGYVWAKADHLTPLVMSADIAAPDRPTSFFATAGDGLVKLRWDRMADTAGYLIRYRQGTNDDTVTYQTVVVNGGDVTTATLKGFENGVLFEFGVASLDWVGNQSHFAVVEQTPVAAGSRADFVVPTAAASKPAPSSSSALVTQSASGTSSGATSQSSGATSQSTPSDSSAIGGSTRGSEQPATPPAGGETSQEADAAGESTPAKETAGSTSRTLVTILIIVIAAAAGFGGYYGYQWWMAKPEVTAGPEPSAPPEPRKKPDKPNGPDTDRNGRW